MTLAFRNVTARPTDPVADWPTEAVRAALERGDLGDWRRLVAEIRRDPWGRTAHQVEEVLGHARPHGITEAMSEVLRRAREQQERDERDVVAAQLRAAVAASGLTQAQFAARIGTSASRLSTYLRGRVTPSAALLVRVQRRFPATEDAPR